MKKFISAYGESEAASDVFAGLKEESDPSDFTAELCGAGIHSKKSFDFVCLYKNNYHDMVNEHRRIFKNFTAAVFFITWALFAISWIIPSYFNLRNVYFIVSVIGTCFFLLGYMRLPDLFVLPAVYALFILIYCFFVFLSLYVSPERIGASIIGLFCVMPIVIIDRSNRINTIMSILYLAHTLASFYFKSFSVACDDAVTDACFFLAGIMIGNHTRKVKLLNYEMRRQSYIRERTDFITGLGNRLAVYKLFETNNETKRSLRIAGIIIVKLINFSKYIDVCGTLAGDKCLFLAAGALKNVKIPVPAEFFRVDTDKFAVFLYGGTGDMLQFSAEKCVEVINMLHIEFPNSESGYVTAGACVAESSGKNSESSEVLFSKAYRASEKIKSGSSSEIRTINL